VAATANAAESNVSSPSPSVAVSAVTPPAGQVTFFGSAVGRHPVPFETLTPSVTVTVPPELVTRRSLASLPPPVTFRVAPDRLTVVAAVAWEGARSAAPTTVAAIRRRVM
jgi:hypothetical protein